MPNIEANSNQAAWSWTATVVAFVTVAASIVWLFLDPGFEPMIMTLGSTTAVLIYFGLRRTTHQAYLDKIVALFMLTVSTLLIIYLASSSSLVSRIRQHQENETPISTENTTSIPIITPTMTLESVMTTTPTIIPVSSIRGKLIWNSQLIPGVNVSLRTHCLGPAVATTISDDNGDFYFDNVKPGTYVYGLNGFNPGSREMLPGFNFAYKIVCTNKPFDVPQNTPVTEDAYLIRSDLRIIEPIGGNTTANVFVAWESYQGAAYYTISINQRQPELATVISALRTTTTRVAIPVTFEPGHTYQGLVTAWNIEEIAIASAYTAEFTINP
jgi:multisubunit Na+/H+ antiporter MnhE subunit